MMPWYELYDETQRPTREQLAEYIANPLWEQLCSWIETTYQSEMLLQYSKCSIERGWNIKYRKGSRAICTMYVREGYVTCMVSIGSKQLAAMEEYLETCTSAVQQLYRDTPLYNGGKWMVIDLTSAEILEDVQGLLRIRMNRQKNQ